MSDRLVPPTPITFESQAAQFDKIGTPGISTRREHSSSGHPVDCVLYRNNTGVLDGVLYYYPAGAPGLEKPRNVNMFVRPEAARTGIATRLLDHATRLFDINLDQQLLTPSGKAFLDAYRRIRPNT